MTSAGGRDLKTVLGRLLIRRASARSEQYDKRDEFANPEGPNISK